MNAHDAVPPHIGETVTQHIGHPAVPAAYGTTFLGMAIHRLQTTGLDWGTAIGLIGAMTGAGMMVCAVWDRALAFADRMAKARAVAKENEALRGRAETVITTAATAASAPAPPSRPLSVLLVEDNDDISYLVVRLLRQAGHHVARESCAADGIARFDREPPDVLLCDLIMPGVDGEALLEHAAASGLPCTLVAMTASADEARIAKVRAMGVAVVAKPPKDNVLLAAIREPNKAGES